MSKLSEEMIKSLLNKHDEKQSNNDVDISFEDIDKFGDKESMQEMFDGVRRYNQMLKQRITFINDDLTKIVPFTRENLYLICAYTGSGKCFSKGTKIRMYDGSVKNVEDIVPGEQVMGPDSQPRNVLSLGRGREMMYDVIPRKGNKYTVNESHILSLKYSVSRRHYKAVEPNSVINISVGDYLKKSNTFKRSAKGYKAPGVDYVDKAVKIDPYFLGLWLGDGSKESLGICTADEEIKKYISDYANSFGYDVHIQKNTRSSCEVHRITTHKSKGNGHSGRNTIRNYFKEYNLFNNKHIPNDYMINSRNIRLQILAGLIDTDGGHCNNCFDFCQKDENLARQIVSLCQSLGLAAYVKPVKKACTNSKTKAAGIYWKISISGNTDMIPTRLPRKQAKPRQQIKDVLNVGIKVSPVGIGDYYGFTVDGDHLFLLEDYTVVHNTTLAANVSFPLWKQGKKVLILSNEESKQDILYRIACLEIGLNFNDWKKGNMPIPEQKLCVQLFPAISQFVKIVDVTYKNGFTSKLEGVKKALTQVQTSDYSCVLIDYFQEVKYSIDNPKRSQYEVLADLSTFMKMYIKQSSVPIVLMAQLHSIGKRKVPELDGRIKHCPDILQAATVAIEVIPNFENKTTDLLIHKDRFGLTGKKIVCGFDKGRYVTYDDSFKQKVQAAKLARLTAAVAPTDVNEDTP